ncbi:methyl-accepting chemotaxis protein [Paludibacterium purpuratum]|uniref:Methyl-accepting chemotaxis protein n=1 Tax=Paludibacterium purpuratum TaxID=1144873 RepID=A0A4R7B6V7_9NEIS|nr:methyl-accepting chemotaxis protein [Paludibacterium purpuratum]TDR80203.1 methyl-accepting chemotaxis protein [Paludibacterium purpuratum]
MLHRFTIRQKLLASFSFVILLLLLLLLAAINNMQNVNGKIHDMTQGRYPKIALASSITVKSMDIGRQIRSAVIFSAGDTEEYLTKVDNLLAAQTTDMDRMETLLFAPRGKELFADVREKSGVLRAALAESYPLIRSHKMAEAAQVVKQKIAPANNRYMASLQAFTDYQEEQMHKGIADAEDSSHQAIINMMLVSGIAIVLAAGSALWIARLISVPLQKSAMLVRNIQNGDLSGADEVIPPARDEALEITRGIQEMRSGLRSIVQAIQLNAHNVSDSAHELSGMAEGVAGSAQQQAEATSEAAATIEQLTVSINHVADNSGEASRQAQDTGSLARHGGKEVIDSVARIQDVSHSVSGTSTQMNMLTDEIRQIGSIVTVIREVADQTNLLALNAAIEAARAGETGRGFAVVADEVRKLAERTTASALEITQMIHSIQQGVERVVDSMGASLESVEAVSGSTEQASQTIERIGRSTLAIEQSIGNITAALGEQRIASQSLAQNMEKVSQMAESNSATVEELATTSSQLSALSNNLQDITARFRL